jgi:AAA15 family ATPase/GTPase
MILTKIDFCERQAADVFWDIKDVHLGMFNLIIGLNAVGKTRLVNIIANFARTLTGKVPPLKNGKWKLEFEDRSENTFYRYNLEIEDKIVKNEEIIKDKKILLKREKEEGKIFSYLREKMIPFNPPKNQLTPHVRRDIKEFPFLEEFLKWAENFRGYMFNHTNPKQILSYQEALLENLNTTPYLLAEAIKNPELRDTIMNDFASIGYPVDFIDVAARKIPGVSGDVLISVVQEKGLFFTTEQDNMSQGMYRAFSLVVILEYLLRLDTECTVVIDDLGEGLDYERSNAVIGLLLKKLENSKIQLIATSNDRFLINAVDVRCLNLLERNGHTVNSYNYLNSKETFEEFKITGLNNFDFFMSKMYREQHHN